MNQPRIPDVLPLLPVDRQVIFPYQRLPLIVSQPELNAITLAIRSEDLLCLLVAEDMAFAGWDSWRTLLSSVGTVARICRARVLPEGDLEIVVRGLYRAEVLDPIAARGPLPARVRIAPQRDVPSPSSPPTETLRSTYRKVGRLLRLGYWMDPDVAKAIGDVSDPGEMADLLTPCLPLTMKQQLALFEVRNPVERLARLNAHLDEIVAVRSRHPHDPNKTLEQCRQELAPLWAEQQARLAELRREAMRTMPPVPDRVTPPASPALDLDLDSLLYPQMDELD